MLRVFSLVKNPNSKMRLLLGNETQRLFRNSTYEDTMFWVRSLVQKQATAKLMKIDLQTLKVRFHVVWRKFFEAKCMLCSKAIGQENLQWPSLCEAVASARMKMRFLTWTLLRLSQLFRVFKKPCN
jgi:hypothetical protein